MHLHFTIKSLMKAIIEREATIESYKTLLKYLPPHRRVAEDRSRSMTSLFS